MKNDDEKVFEILKYESIETLSLSLFIIEFT